jgi:hypothetical protein
MPSLVNPSLHLPLQLAPVERTLAKSGSLSVDGGLVASQNWGQILGQAAQAAIPILGTLF